jgi:hypothetical protein
MKTVTVLGWKPGFQKVRFTDLLRREFGYSLSGAKAATDGVLDNRRLELNIPDAEYDRVLPRLLELGAEVANGKGRAERSEASDELELSKS